MTTLETRNEHLTEMNSKLKAEVSRLQGIAHGRKLENEQLLLDVRTLQERCQDGNLEIIELQQRCCTCGIGGGG